MEESRTRRGEDTVPEPVLEPIEPTKSIPAQILQTESPKGVLSPGEEPCWAGATLQCQQKQGQDDPAPGSESSQARTRSTFLKTSSMLLERGGARKKDKFTDMPQDITIARDAGTKPGTLHGQEDHFRRTPTSLQSSRARKSQEDKEKAKQRRKSQRLDLMSSSRSLLSEDADTTAKNQVPGTTSMSPRPASQLETSPRASLHYAR